MTAKDLLKVSLVLTLVACGSTAYATAFSGAFSFANGSSFTPSSNVTMELASAPANYAATAQHLSGDRVYFANNADSHIYYTTKATGTTTSIGPTATQTELTWSSL